MQERVVDMVHRAMVPLEAVTYADLQLRRGSWQLRRGSWSEVNEISFSPVAGSDAF